MVCCAVCGLLRSAWSVCGLVLCVESVTGVCLFSWCALVQGVRSVVRGAVAWSAVWEEEEGGGRREWLTFRAHSADQADWRN